MAGTTISTKTDTDTGLRLTLASQNPVAVTSHGTITSSYLDAIYGGPDTAWTVDNAGTLNARGTDGKLNESGIDLRAGALVSNAVSATITANGYRGTAVEMSGSAGSVINGGSITAADSGFGKAVLFVNKKNQKNFGNLARSIFKAAGKIIKSFLVTFFQKSNCLLCYLFYLFFEKNLAKDYIKVNNFPKVKKMRVFTVVLLSPLLAACSYTMNQNSIMASDVQSVSLANGKSLDVGYKLPEAVAGCQLVNQTTRNWAVAQAEGQLKFGGGRQVLQDEAVASVNQRPQAGINYVALIIPNEADIGIVNVTAGQDATTSYFSCTTAP